MKNTRSTSILDSIYQGSLYWQATWWKQGSKWRPKIWSPSWRTSAAPRSTPTTSITYCVLNVISTIIIRPTFRRPAHVRGALQQHRRLVREPVDRTRPLSASQTFTVLQEEDQRTVASQPGHAKVCRRRHPDDAGGKGGEQLPASVYGDRRRQIRLKRTLLLDEGHFMAVATHTAVTIQWALILIANHPDVQVRIQKKMFRETYC